jgi:magnesium and cobalt transporter
MGSSSDDLSGDSLTQGDSSRAPGHSSVGRSFIGRVLSAFTTHTEANAPPTGRSSPGGQPIAAPQLGLGNLRRLRVDDVSIPKADIAAVPVDIDKEALVAAFRTHGFSRMPVYKGTMDHPLGLVLLKDLALQHGFGGGGRFLLKKLLRPVLYAPPSMPAAVLLQKMQRDRVHMALVIDEYGGVDGLVTIEDLIETVIGEIEDEHDEAEGALWKQEREGVFLAQSTAPLEEFEAAIGMTLRAGDDDDEIDTLGGLVFLRAGRVPTRGEIVPHESGIEFEVIDADPRRIKRLRIRMPGYQATHPAAKAATTDTAKTAPQSAGGAE